MSAMGERKAHTTAHMVVIHHWIYATGLRKPTSADLDGADDSVRSYGYECSLPVELRVTESTDPDKNTTFHVSGIPDECGVCKRTFFGHEKHRIRSEAISAHLRLTGMLDKIEPGVTFTTPRIDVVLDA